ncbi:amidohydrolase family protein [Nonomuraea roseoviolacea]|uniref:TIM-barrel fold metal-dependent hydrolase n=1 Tax=Nonomuraea roseoviolacea subsp. carminata TaxID=160689 RepID=A0ABT1KCG1_9ACTN|nr:amidohydrolase family protein [Nonomuraea roseoviolacea]MCP2351704.1 putative TIM-barrel fold metal-dependent hydrolase [Nonomuraea roseoviolacea subsp. carminata]
MTRRLPQAPVLDAHGHIGTWPDFLIPDPSAEGLVATMDRVGVTAMGVSHLLAVGPDAGRGNRLAMETAARFPGRFGVWQVYNPHHRTPLVSDGVWGVKLHPDVHQCPLDDPRYEPVWRLGLPVLAHGQTDSPWSDPARFAAVAARHPDVPLLMGHTGLWPYGFDRAARLAAGHPNLHLEVCGSRMTGRWIARLAATIGAERVLFGSDACFLDLRTGYGRVALAPLTEADRALIQGGNLARLLGPRLLGPRLHGPRLHGPRLLGPASESPRP